ncbi:TraB/VirB10 family protein [Desulfurivibrio sp. D14AmB]|uniref:TraB/VirB10 family protein n=1 Tax=Desulfurivibrio sp. D14AmB TaxID=3374370 RepID=UPI00376F196B
MKLKEKFDNLTPGQKKVVVWSLLGAVFLLVTVVGYNSRSSVAPSSQEGQKTREITLEPDLLQKTMLREQRIELEEMRDELKRLRDERERERRSPLPPPEQTLPAQPPIPSAEDLEQLPPMAGSFGSRFPLPPGQQSSPPTPPPPPKPPVEPMLIGAIGVITNTTAPPAVIEDKKKERRTVYLPPSFMEARLLTGFDASTSGSGSNNPEPILLRIQTPAVLPNDIKANLRGCFVVAEAVGRLHKERADVRLVSLSCLSNSGDAIIDTPIKGFVTDSDSKVGLAGRVVSKMGATLARTVMAGMIGGVGDAFSAAAKTQSVSALGITSAVVDSDDLTRAAIGGGVSEGAKTLADFYLDLAKQTTPVIEVNATKNITVVISEGKELEIREIANGTL